MAKKKTARKTRARRSPVRASVKRVKRSTAPRGLNLKKVRADLLLAIGAMKKSPAVALGERALDSDQAQLEEMVARINDFCERDRRCGTGMVIPI